MATPVLDRLSGARAGGRRASGLAALRAQFNAAESEKAFAEWAKHPVTALVRRALNDMALNGPVALATPESYAVQHGMTVGLGLAAQMLEDPSTVFPDMFSGAPQSGAVSVSEVPEAFRTNPHEALDSME